MAETAETYEHKGVEVRIYWDDDPRYANPREMESNVTELICWHPDYVLGDRQIRGSRGAVETVFETARGRTDFSSMRAIHRYISLMLGGRRVTPLYLYDHSGISISAGTPSPWDNPRVRSDEFGQGLGWDSSMVGFAFCTDERINELCGEAPGYHTDAWIDEAIRSDVRRYDEYLRGSVYGYVVAEGTDDQDACWGFLGSDHDESGLREAANEAAAYVAEGRAERRRTERLYLMAPETTGGK